MGASPISWYRLGFHADHRLHLSINLLDDGSCNALLILTWLYARVLTAVYMGPPSKRVSIASWNWIVFLTAGISRSSRLKRRATGGHNPPYRKKRKFELGRQAANTKLGAKRIHTVRTRGGNHKYRALRLDSGMSACFRRY